MKTILLVGSSIFEQWYNAQDIVPSAIIRNRAIGGTITADWVGQLAAVLRSEGPDVVLFYCGSNDVSRGVPDADIMAHIRQCRALVHTFSAEAKFAYFSITKAPQKAGQWMRIDRLNAAIQQGLHEDDLYVETNTVFFAKDHPVSHLFVADGLHLTDAAYDTLLAYVQPLISTWLNGAA